MFRVTTDDTSGTTLWFTMHFERSHLQNGNSTSHKFRHRFYCQILYKLSNDTRVSQQVATAVEAAQPFKEELAERGVLLIPLPIYSADDGAVAPDSIPLTAGDLRCALCDAVKQLLPSQPVIHSIGMCLCSIGTRALAPAACSYVFANTSASA